VDVGVAAVLTPELNEKLTRVGPGTPGGELLRHYWHPIAGVAELDEHPTKRVRLLGEDLVLYRDRAGKHGLIGERCPHRRISLYYGIPEPFGIRCPYHGWAFDHAGQCLEQPAEPEGSTFKERVQAVSYPVEELGGLIFAYLGPQPAPELPRYDLFACENAVRQAGFTVLPCNWVQAMENSLDATHVEWLHGYYTNYLNERAAAISGLRFQPRAIRPHVKIGFDRFEHGIIKRRVEAGGSEEDDDWKIGHPVVFPYTLKTGAVAASSFQIRVPMDDTHTLHILYRVYRPGIPVPPEIQDRVTIHQVPWAHENGDAVVDFTLGQDMMAWATQGEIAERHLEKLGASDTGVILYRELLEEQIDRVARGEEPLEVYRDPDAASYVVLPQERTKHGTAQWGRPTARVLDGLYRHMPVPPEVTELFRQAEELEATGQELHTQHASTLEAGAARRREVALKR
jgi:5,5'-dehydrodivanillate O-demethylase oxygenase subunit